LAVVAAAGCNRAPFKTLPVTGTVKYQDGSLIPAQRLVVIFVPQAEPLDAKTHPRPGRANVNVQTGEFSNMTTHQYADGATVGANVVQILGVDEGETPAKAVLKKYTDPTTSGLKVEVGPDSTHFDLTIDKP
jgi:hypothetical protein